ncbi:MAG TPA: hypothetical protein VE079_15860 [Ensifer sp.]|nr:hypothetical protein [Ensifer sp.]
MTALSKSLEPAIGLEGRSILRSIRLLGGSMPAAGVDNRPLLLRLVAQGLITRHGPGHALLSLTVKGEAKLDAMMRCE